MSMKANTRRRRTIEFSGRQVRTGSGSSFYYHEVHTLFDELIDGPWGIARWYPPADVVETPEAFCVEMDVAGVLAEKVTVHVDDHTLVIEGQRDLRRAGAGEVLHVCERPTGRFTRRFCFEAALETEGIDRRIIDGVLIVVVRKRTDRQERADG